MIGEKNRRDVGMNDQIMEVTKTRLFLIALFLSVLTKVCGDKMCNNDNCYATNGYVCNNQGSCDCGTCVCTHPYSGITCEECPTCPTPCEIFKGCVGCKIFGTGLVGIMECITQCDYLANYIPVEKDQFDLETDDSDLMLCKHTNEDFCVESFKIGGMTGGYRDLYVRTEMDCTPIEVATLPPRIEVPVVTSKLEPTTHLIDAVTSTSGQYISTVDSSSSTLTPVVLTDKQTDSVEVSTSEDNTDKVLIRVDMEDPDQSVEDSTPQNITPVSGSDNPNSGCRSRSDSPVVFLFVCVYVTSML